MRNNKGQFTAGIPSDRRFPIGSIRTRTRYTRNGEKRKYIKVAEPGTWVLLCHYIWEFHHGKIPTGYGLHHKDEDKLNDLLANLEIVTKAEHLSIHRKTFKDKAVANFIKTRRKMRWSTKSSTKITGRHPKNCPCPLHFPRSA